jgi:4-amino-4-deoxy-L-arabinose transferase-like glycosyltransferase
MYGAMHTGWPAKPAANVAKLAQGYVPQFNMAALGLAVGGTLAWLALVRWRTRRQVHPLWKSMVLPAGGVVLCWLLLMTLWLPLLDYARSYRPVVDRVLPHLSASQGSCVAVRGASPSLVASLEVFSDLRYDATAGAERQAACKALIQVTRGSFQGPPESLLGWQLQATILRPTDRDEQIGVYRRVNREP